MKKSYLLTLTLLLISSGYFAQHYSDQWYFGNMAALDFSGGAPTVVTTSQMTAGEGSASIADPETGDLMFYTDGISVWDANNTLMPNGTGLMGGGSSTQAALIVPVPLDINRFYIFTTDETGGSRGLRFSVVNMSLNGGYGDVETKNTLLKTPVTEKVSAVQEYGTPNYWVLAHGWNEDAFYAYKLTPTGIDSAVVSHSGIVHTDAQIQNSYGQMKFNTCGDRIALTTGYLDKVQLFNFGIATGVVSNPQTISYADHVYGIEFSPNSTLLYVSTYETNGTLLQYDLTQPNIAAIISSVQVVSTTPDIYPLQRGPDGKIYVVRSYSQFLGVIQSPNSAGSTACNYVENSIDLDPGFLGASTGIGLPNFVSSFMGGTFICPSATAGVDDNILPENTVFPNPSNGSFTFTGDNYSGVFITDASGKLIENRSASGGMKFTFGENYVSGVYFVNAINKSGTISVLKIVKTN